MDPKQFEIVAMVLSSTPVPPLPLVVGKEIPDEITYVAGEHVICNSHDLLAMLMVSAMQRNDKAENEMRQKTQQTATEKLFQDLDLIDTNDPNCEEKVFALFSTYTRGQSF